MGPYEKALQVSADRSARRIKELEDDLAKVHENRQNLVNLLHRVQNFLRLPYAKLPTVQNVIFKEEGVRRLLEATEEELKKNQV